MRYSERGRMRHLDLPRGQGKTMTALQWVAEDVVGRAIICANGQALHNLNHQARHLGLGLRPRNFVVAEGLHNSIRGSDREYVIDELDHVLHALMGVDISGFTYTGESWKDNNGSTGEENGT